MSDDPRADLALQKQVQTLGIPAIRRHILLCAEPTKPKCCATDLGLASWTFLKGRLKDQELSMISERELRDMRREATIIYR